MKSLNAGLLILKEDLRHYPENGFVEYVLYPYTVNAFKVRNETGSPDKVMVSVLNRNVYEPNNAAHRQELVLLDEKERIDYSAEDIDKLTYHYPSKSASGTNVINWSESVVAVQCSKTRTSGFSSFCRCRIMKAVWRPSSTTTNGYLNG